MKHALLLSIPTLLVCLSASAQAVKPVSIANDKAVTISVSFSKAGEVYLKGSFVPKARTYKTPAGVFGKEGKLEMERSQGCVWTYTTNPLPSELYTYNFELNEVDTFDVSNPNQVRNINTIYNYFIITDGIADDYVDDDVPHGKVGYVWYQSSLPDLPRRRMAIYTPPQYSSGGSYPVLYLLHGSGGDETSWLGLGRAAQILDNLIAAKRCQPMIVVMPNGNSDRAATPGADPYNTAPASVTAFESMLGLTESIFVSEVVNYVERHYRTINDKEHRAIAGLSLGGLHTLFISANVPSEFGYVGLFSAQTTNMLTTSEKIGSVKKLASAFGKFKGLLKSFGGGNKRNHIDRLAEKVNEGKLDIYDNLDEKLKRQFANPPSLYYIACGKDVFVKKLNDDFRAKLDAGGYKYVYNETDGGHSWENWRKYLVDFLPRLFKNQ